MEQFLQGSLTELQASIIGKIVLAIIILIIAIILWAVLKKVISKIPESKFNKRIQGILKGCIKYAIVATTIILILELFGVNVTSIIAGLGVVGVVAGLALQDLLKDLIQGFNIVADGYYKVGDAVMYNGDECVVLDFNLKTTKLKSYSDGSTIVVSNRNINCIKQLPKLLNLNYSFEYGADIAVIRKFMEDVVETLKKHPDVENAVFKGTQEFGASAIVYRISVTCPLPNKYDVMRYANGLVQDMAAERGINIPFDQLDVHMVQ